MPSGNQDDQVNRHILVVDDTACIHEDFRRILMPDQEREDPGLLEAEALLFGDDSPADAAEARADEVIDYKIESALSGEAGLAIVEKFRESANPIAMAFVDMRMPPGWNGLETIKHLWECDPRLQIVICSAYSDVSWDSIRKELGKRDNLLILRKPFEPEEVQQLADALTFKRHQEIYGRTIYTVTREYPIRLVEIKPKRITSTAIVCDDFIVLPNGDRKKIFMKGRCDYPTTPALALQQFIQAQQKTVSEMTEKVSLEAGKLEQAKTLLKQLEVTQ